MVCNAIQEYSNYLAVSLPLDIHNALCYLVFSVIGLILLGISGLIMHLMRVREWYISIGLFSFIAGIIFFISLLSYNSSSNRYEKYKANPIEFSQQQITKKLF